MPDVPHPPFVSGAVIVPRQLNRWLDVNPQGGPLGRTQSYVTLPTFSVSYVWNQVSDIITSFNFEAPNNFSLLIDATGNVVVSSSSSTGGVSPPPPGEDVTISGSGDVVGVG